MKPRIIDPSFWEDVDVASITRDERLLLIAMITGGADDEGRIKANALYLKRLAFPYDSDVTIEQTEQMILNIGGKCKNVLLYGVNGERYATFRNWQKYQEIKYRAKSKLPAPIVPQESPQFPEPRKDFPELEKVSEPSPKFPKPSTGSVGLDSVELGRGRVDTPPPPKNASPNGEKDDIEAAWKAWVDTRQNPMALHQADVVEFEAKCQEYPPWQIREAILEANRGNRGGQVSWNFVDAILERWARVGTGPTRDSPALDRIDEGEVQQLIKQARKYKDGLGVSYTEEGLREAAIAAIRQTNGERK